MYIVSAGKVRWHLATTHVPPNVYLTEGTQVYVKRTIKTD